MQLITSNSNKYVSLKYPYFMSTEKKVKNPLDEQYALNGFVDFILVLSCLLNALGALASGFNLATDPIVNFINMILYAVTAILCLRVMDNDKYALFAIFGLLGVSAVIKIVSGSLPFSLIQAVLLALILCLKKKGRSSWNIILNTPREFSNNPSTLKLILGFLVVLVIVVVAGAVIHFK